MEEEAHEGKSKSGNWALLPPPPGHLYFIPGWENASLGLPLDFPVVKTRCFHCRGPPRGSIPGWELRSHKPRSAARKQRNKLQSPVAPSVAACGVVPENDPQ